MPKKPTIKTKEKYYSLSLLEDKIKVDFGKKILSIVEEIDAFIKIHDNVVLTEEGLFKIARALFDQKQGFRERLEGLKEKHEYPEPVIIYKLKEEFNQKIDDLIEEL